jgi:hypothetical protein
VQPGTAAEPQRRGSRHGQALREQARRRALPPKYYEPTSYDKPHSTPPPANVTVPVRIPMREISSVEKWEPVVLSNDSKKGLFIVGGILVGLVAALAIVIIQNNNE